MKFEAKPLLQGEKVSEIGVWSESTNAMVIGPGDTPEARLGGGLVATLIELDNKSYPLTTPQYR